MKIKNKRGRPIGATSTIRVKLGDLKKYLTDEATICVGRSWLEEIGIGIDETQIAKIKVIKKKPENTIVETKDLI